MGRPRLLFDRGIFYQSVVAVEAEKSFDNIGLLVDAVLEHYNSSPGIPAQIEGAHNVRNRLLAFSEEEGEEYVLSDGEGQTYRLKTTKGRRGRRPSRPVAQEAAPKAAPRAATANEARQLEREQEVSAVREDEEERREAYRDKRLTSFERAFMRCKFASELLPGDRVANYAIAVRGDSPEVEEALKSCENSFFRG